MIGHNDHHTHQGKPCGLVRNYTVVGQYAFALAVAADSAERKRQHTMNWRCSNSPQSATASLPPIDLRACPAHSANSTTCSSAGREARAANSDSKTAACLPACLPAHAWICYRSQSLLIRFFRSLVSESWTGSPAPTSYMYTAVHATRRGPLLHACCLRSCCWPTTHLAGIQQRPCVMVMGGPTCAWARRERRGGPGPAE